LGAEVPFIHINFEERPQGRGVTGSSNPKALQTRPKNPGSAVEACASTSTQPSYRTITVGVSDKGTIVLQGPALSSSTLPPTRCGPPRSQGLQRWLRFSNQHGVCTLFSRSDRIQTMVFDFDAKHGNIFKVHSTVQEVCCWTIKTKHASRLHPCSKSCIHHRRGTPGQRPGTFKRLG
jgi:hypothetical protein